MSRSAFKAYVKKRDFNKTPEPGGKKTRGSNWPVFVIQKHDATNLHYDFRLEFDGVLKSWAVPRGPSTDPRVKRLAIRTEDHPLDYAKFEGVIPEGEYGGGTVLIWDGGPYRNLAEEKPETKSMKEALDNGHIEVWLEGEKLRGGYVLVRTDSKAGEGAKWLLIKIDDDQADARRNPVSTEPKSVLSGRTLEEIRSKEA